MLPSLAAIAAARQQCRHPDHQRVLDELALRLLLLRLVERDLARLRALLCRLDAQRSGGDDDERDAAAA